MANRENGASGGAPENRSRSTRSRVIVGGACVFLLLAAAAISQGMGLWSTDQTDEARQTDLSLSAQDLALSPPRPALVVEGAANKAVVNAANLNWATLSAQHEDSKDDAGSCYRSGQLEEANRQFALGPRQLSKRYIERKYASGHEVPYLMKLFGNGSSATVHFADLDDCIVVSTITCDRQCGMDGPVSSFMHGHKTVVKKAKPRKYTKAFSCGRHETVIIVDGHKECVSKQPAETVRYKSETETQNAPAVVINEKRGIPRMTCVSCNK